MSLPEGDDSDEMKSASGPSWGSRALDRIGQCRGRSQRGAFTLIEMMITIVILAIVASLVVPLAGEDGVARLRAAARLLIADLEFAQVESMTHGDDPRIMVFDPILDSYMIAAATDPAVPITHHLTGEPYLVQYGVGRTSQLEGVTIESVALDGDNQVRFGVYGQLDQATPGTITLGSMGRTITITLDPDTGEASLGPIQ